MSTIMRMPTAIPNKLTHFYPTRFDTKKPSKPCFVSTNSSINGPINRTCSKAQLCNDQLIIPNERRSGNYKPPIWGFDFIQSLSSDFNKDVKYLKKASELTVQVKMMLDKDIVREAVDQQLEFIDDLHWLNISYHFDKQIKRILNHIHDEGCENYDPTDLYSTSLRFRILRQHGFSVSQEVFDCFKNEYGDFKASLGADTKGLLQLYEASFMLTRGEKTLELARDFAANFLQKIIDDDDENIEEHLSLLVRDALELPLHWRAQRPNARSFINAYERRPHNMNPLVLDLAKLDFNIVQATHQQELKHVSRWWKQTGLAEKLPFARDRLVECYLLAVGGIRFEPPYGYERITITKINALIAILDDMFDVYGTFEELQLFNDVVQRWDIDAMDKLPDYMRICFLAMNNFIDEVAYHVLKEEGSFIITHLRKSWADLCQTYLQEAEWYFKGHTPKLEEYISNAWVSITAPVILTHAYFLVTNPIRMETVQSLYKYHNIVRCCGMIYRLANDLGTSPDEMERGDVPKAIECYMIETGGGVEEAQKHVRFMIDEAWKEMNEERVGAGDVFQPEFVRCAVDYGRMMQYIYQYGDGFGAQNFPQMKPRISSLLFEPIVVANN